MAPVSGLVAPSVGARPLNIVQLMPCLNTGGIERNVLRLMQSLGDRHNITLVAPDGPGRALFEDQGIPREDLSTSPVEYLTGFRDSVRVLRRLMADQPVDLVQVRVEAGIMGPLRRAFPDLPIVYTNEGTYGFERLKFWLTSQAINWWSDVAYTVSDHHFERFLRGGVNPGKMRLIRNGVPAPNIDPNTRVELLERLALDPGRHIVIGTLARLEKEKALDVLIAAAQSVRAAVPNAKFVIAGEGSLRSKLARQIQKLGLGNTVRMPGFVADAGSLMSCLDIYCQPSRDEAFGLAVSEAMATGLPVVGSREGGIAEQVVHRQTGLLFETDNTGELAAALIDVARDPSLRARFGTAGKARHAAEFSQDIMTRRTEEVFFEAIDRRRSLLAA